MRVYDARARAEGEGPASERDERTQPAAPRADRRPAKRHQQAPPQFELATHWPPMLQLLQQFEQHTLPAPLQLLETPFVRQQVPPWQFCDVPPLQQSATQPQL